MSGIAGIIRFDGAPVDRSAVVRMTETMRHRGPDGISHWVHGSVGLGQCMMRTTAESLEETLPLANEDETVVLVFHGWLSNWEDLRRDLLAHRVRLRSGADAELVLRAYETWGRDCPSHIDGEFAFVIWDARERAAFCVRDRFGIKPFYYRIRSNTLIFASEIKPVLDASGVSREFNLGFLAEVMGNEWHSWDETLYRGVMRLPQAMTLSISKAAADTQEYWHPPLDRLLHLKSDADYADAYRQTLVETVRRYSRSHLPLGFTVSGGLDSTALYSLAVGLNRQGKLPATDLRAFTLDFSHDADANEIEFVEAIEEFLGVKVERVPPVLKDADWYLERAARTAQFPGYPNASDLVGVHEALRSAGGRVLIGGTGGDQILQGSHSYYCEELVSLRWRNLAECMRADANAVGVPTTARLFLRHGLAPLLPRRLRRWGNERLRARKYSSSRRAVKWLSLELQELLMERRAQAQLRRLPNLPRHGLNWRQHVRNSAFERFAAELREHLPAENGVEWRLPFYSRDLVELVYSFPDRQFLRGDRIKHVHRLALASDLPTSIAQRNSKAQFDNALGEMTKSIIPLLLSQDGSDRHLFDIPELEKLTDSYLTNGAEGWQIWAIWSILGCRTLHRSTHLISSDIP